MPEQVIARDRIDGWAKIARHLGCDVTTAIRWAKAGHLKVHQPSGRRGAVHAYRHELDAWLAASYRPDDALGRDGGGHGKTAFRPSISTSHLEGGSTAPVSTQFVEVVTKADPQKPHRSWRWWALAATAVFVVPCGLFGYRYAERHLFIPSSQLIESHQLTSNGLEKYGLRTNGKHLYFGQYQSGWLALAEMPLDGGPIHFLWNPPMNVLPVDISPGGQFLLALNGINHDLEREIWVVPVSGDPPHKLGSLRAHSVAYAPDEKTIAFANDQSIYLAAADGSSSREIGKLEGVPDSLHWSTDGSRLYFALLDPVSRKPSLWELKFADGKVAQSLRSVPSPVELNADFQCSSAVREDAYFCADRGLWLVQYGRAWLQPAIQVRELLADMSGSRGIAFDKASNRLFVVSDNQSHDGIKEYDPRTKELRYILPGVSGAYPDYSRDKQWIAWVDHDRSGGSALWMARADGSMRRRLASFQDDIELPRWAPDGTQIAFMGREPGLPYRDYIVSRDGGEPREAGSQGSENQGAPTWSPDGRALAYGNVQCLESHTCAVHTIDLVTGKVRTLPGSEGMMTARWSPDGRYIAALRPELHQLLLFDVRQQLWKMLADSIDTTDLGWSSNSEFLYVALPGEDARITRISAATGKDETVLKLDRLNTYDLATVHDDVFSVAPDDHLLLSRPNPSSEIYSWRVQER